MWHFPAYLGISSHDMPGVTGSPTSSSSARPPSHRVVTEDIAQQCIKASWCISKPGFWIAGDEKLKCLEHAAAEQHSHSASQSSFFKGAPDCNYRHVDAFNLLDVRSMMLPTSD